MKNIKIAVACHKPSNLPKNDLFMPIQVGSAIAAKRLTDMEHDDIGHNISKKNQTYCELTAQYWLWKNVDADYYGLCHYRRFLCFADINERKNVRGQFEAGAIDEFNIKRFGLENEKEMRTIIEENDVVSGNLQHIPALYTPRGNQKTAYAHWVAHDRALIKKEDLQAMLNILSAVSPEVGAATRKYLNGNKFSGFNCFVMKKQLFNEMCSIEFKVLEELEKQVDLTTYNQQLSRIYGFMAEIISSGYIYYLEQQKTYKVKHVPLVYFNYTDEHPTYLPLERENVIPVFFDQTGELEFAFGSVLQSFLDQTEQNYYYDLFVAMRNVQPYTKQLYQKLIQSYTNVSLRFIPAELYETMMIEQTKYPMEILPYLPWLLPYYQKIMVFGADLIFKKNISELWNEKFEKNLILAPADILMRARVNDIYKETEENYILKQMAAPLDYFSTKVMVLDLQGIRKQYSEHDILKNCRNHNKELRCSSEVYNVLYAGHVKLVSQQWNTMYESNDYLKYQLPYAPKTDYLALLSARKSPAIISYMPRDPWNPQMNEVSIEFWNIAQRLPMYQKYLAHMAYIVSSEYKRNNKAIIDKLFPHDSQIRGIFIKLFPQGSNRRKIMKKILYFLRLM